jgi:hypothetical protein
LLTICLLLMKFSYSSVYQGKHYLWGVFKRSEVISDEGVIAAEQDGSACAVEEGQLQEQHLPNQQDEVQPESRGQETSAVKLVGNEPLVEYNPEAEKEAITISMTGVTLPGSSLPHEKPDTPTAGSNSSVAHPKEVNMQQDEGVTSSHDLNASTIADPTVEEGGRGQSSSVSVAEPPTIKLFGVTIARTPRAQQQLIQEMPSEGLMVLSVPEVLVAANSNTGNSTGSRSWTESWHRSPASA